MVKTRVIRLRVIEGPNARDQIALCAFNSFFSGSTKRMLPTCMRRMRNNNLEIRIEGSSFRLQIFLESRKFQPQHSYKIYFWNDYV